MKRLFFLLIFVLGLTLQAQTKSEMISHYEAFYKQMRSQGDINGVITALTHLNVLDPNTQRRDTLAYVYTNSNQHVQALNTLQSIDKNEADSDLAVQVKAISLKALNQPKRAIEHFEVLFTRNPNAYLAYELADLKIQVGDNAGATTNIDYGIANANDEMKYAFYERQQPYEVPLKAALIHLKGLALYNMDHNNIDTAISTIDEALKIDPNFNLASLSKQALESRKQSPEENKN